MTPTSIDSAKTLLLPAELYRPGEEAEYLRFSCMSPTGDEQIVVSEPSEDGIIAIIATSEQVPDREVVTSPLLEVAGRWFSGREVNILLTERNVYIAVHDKRLCYAEVFPDNSTDSILYYMQVLGRRFKFRRFTINVAGEGAEPIAEMLDGYFKNVQIVEL